MSNIKKFRLKAFTLAEVLITLGIIGVVATMTIPTLMKNIQDTQYKQAWKKEFSVLYNATMRIMNDNGGTMENICSSVDQVCFRNAYTDKYLKVIKTCDSNASYGNCWDYTNSNDHKGTWGGNSSGAILNDGAFLMFSYSDVTCSNAAFGTNISRCGNIFIDTNGFKGPNLIGKDIHCVIIAKNSIIPLGSNQITAAVAQYGSGSVWTNSADYLYKD